jgi:hypothetical protein
MGSCLLSLHSYTIPPYNLVPSVQAENLKRSQGLEITLGRLLPLSCYGALFSLHLWVCSSLSLYPNLAHLFPSPAVWVLGTILPVIGFQNLLVFPTDFLTSSVLPLLLRTVLLPVA